MAGKQVAAGVPAAGGAPVVTKAGVPYQFIILNLELIFGGTAGTGGRVKILSTA